MRAIRLTLLSVGLVLLGAAAAVAQQTGTITGQVTDASTGQPLAGVQMQVVGTSLGMLTDQRGRYLIPQVPAGQQTIRAILIGYSQGRQTVTVTAGATASADFQLEVTAISLDELVVTATGERQRSREVGVNVGKVNMDNVPMAAVNDVSSVLQARAPGVTVMQAGGTLGTGYRIRIRGSASISLDNDPLIVVDGVMVSNSMSNSIGVGGQDVSRLDDFRPEDIQNIDILKGPAASALYGTAAANGVIVITTKKGQSGTSKWKAFIEQGSMVDKNQYPTNYSGYCSIYDDTGALYANIGTCDSAYFSDLDGYYSQFGYTMQKDSLLSYNPLMNHSDENSPFQTGNRQKYGLSVSGGTDRVTYFLSGDWEKGTGIYRNVSNLKNIGLRANLSSQVTDNLDLSLQTGYITSDLRLPQNDNNVLGVLPSALLGGATPEDGFGFFTLDQLQAIDTRQQVHRLTSSFQTNFRPLAWLSFNGTAGMDVVDRFDNETIPPESVPYSSLPEGERTSNRIRLSSYTAAVNGSAQFQLTPIIGSNSDAGVQFVLDRAEGTYAYGRGLLAGCYSLNCVATGFSVDESTTETRRAGVYVSQQFSLHDRLFLTGTVRADDSSAFGKDLNLTWYPSANLSWVLNDEPWFPHVGQISQVRLRAGWGRAGLMPGFRTARVYLNPDATTIAGTVVPAFDFGGIGNPDLKPEVSTETELGADFGFLNDRIGLELTYYNKHSRDALVSRDLAPSLGVATSQTINIGEVRNTGIETLLRVNVFNTHKVRWDASVSYSTNDNKLLTLGKDPTTGEKIKPIIYGLGGDTQRFQEGFPLGAYFQNPYTYNDANGDGVIQVDEVTVADTAVYLGSPFPGREASIQTSVTLFDWVRVSGLLDYKGDYTQYNATYDFRCGAYYNCKDDYTGYAGLNIPLDRQAAAVANGYGGVTGNTTVAGYMEDGTFWKLREVTLTVMLPADWAARFGATGMNLTFAGRNLHTWTNYSGMDPEINGGGAGSNFNTFDFLSQPPIRYYTVRLDVNF